MFLGSMKSDLVNYENFILHHPVGFFLAGGLHTPTIVQARSPPLLETSQSNSNDLYCQISSKSKLIKILIQYMNQQSACKLGLKPGSFWWHDLITV